LESGGIHLAELTDGNDRLHANSWGMTAGSADGMPIRAAAASPIPYSCRGLPRKLVSGTRV